ncbi:flagellar hook capping FlgD N-terminal domain-containing protein [Ruegeria profundi]|uniref:Basal-body rod modification protein FlgD n=1 Tax=Ruegeria profundi TaxID=1685378 RepID=A0A0X3TTE1_9RHOB|nr:flagellar hook capping FlgD N-terminal domain-containing protein [Ruegeria profundi]KUJ78988.1 flagellar biosynthesis protein FlgD [Ruegeria profundi]
MINPTQATTQTNTQVTSASQSRTSSIASDFDTFLLLMTTQAQNQDPLEPIGSAEYASQLAQFSMVEQQVQTNDRLSELALTLGSVKLDELANWVGMSVQTTSFQFDGDPVTMHGQAAAEADSAEMVIVDSEGTEVDRVSIPVTQSEFTWDGIASDGSPLPPGSYSATLESYYEDELISTLSVSPFSKVVEAQAADGTVSLTLDNGQSVPVWMVTLVST